MSRERCEKERQLNVFLSRQCGHEIIKLENEADVSSAPGCQLTFAQLFDGLIRNRNRTLRGTIQTTDQIEQRALARARGPHESQELTSHHLQVELIKHRCDFGSTTITFDDFRNGYQHVGHSEKGV